MQVFCISGRAQHGKDTAAQMMRRIMWGYGKRVLIIHNADLLKFMCRQLFAWNGEKDEHGRSLLQYIGTDVVRAQRPEFWVKYIADVLSMFDDVWDFVLIPDCRFPNEVEFLRDCGFDVTHVRITRDGVDDNLTDEQRNHLSETAMDGTSPDITINNTGTMVDLYGELLRYLQRECSLQDGAATFIDSYI